MVVRIEIGIVMSVIIVVCSVLMKRNRIMLIKIEVVSSLVFSVLIEVLMKLVWWKVMCGVFMLVGREVFSFVSVVLIFWVRLMVFVVGCFWMLRIIVGLFLKLVLLCWIVGVNVILVICCNRIGCLFFVVNVRLCKLFSFDV